MATAAKALPAQYAKFITALAGAGIAYLTAYGPVWDLQGFLVSLGAALAVFGVPNAGKPADVTLTVPGQSGKAAASGAVTIVPPAPGSGA